jgi:hypothetical protein
MLAIDEKRNRSGRWPDAAGSKGKAEGEFAALVGERGRPDADPVGPRFRQLPTSEFS